MDNNFYKLYHDFESHLDTGMSADIQAFLNGSQEIKHYDIELDQDEKVLIKIKLYKFSKNACKKLFFEFFEFIGYEDINLFICENNQNQIRYIFLTTCTTCSGVKMDIIIS